MKKLFYFYFIIFSFSTCYIQAEKEKIKDDTKFRLITMLTSAAFSKQLYIKQELNDVVSERIFNKFFDTLDPTKIYLSKDDLARFEHKKTMIDDELKKGDSSFAFEVFEFFLKRIEEYKYFSIEYANQNIDFTSNETYTFNRKKIERVDNIEDLKELWKKKIKNEFLSIEIAERVKELEKKEKLLKPDEEKDEEKDEDEDKDEDEKEKKTPKEKVIKSIERISKAYKNLEKFDVLEFYLTSHAKVIDPHSAYMSPASEADFNIHMQLSLGGIGAMLSSKEGYTEVVELIMGGPAEKAGDLKEKDRIIAVGQNDEEPVDIVNMSLNKVVKLIRGKKGTVVKLTVISKGKGVNSTPHIISIKRDNVDLSESSGAHSEIKKVILNEKEYNIGIIELPSFYIDFQAKFKGLDFKSATKDIKKILKDFSGKNIDGIIVDLRNNGGGSLQEAITLTGLFINKGPVVQVKEKKDDIRVHRDNDPKIYYDGPLFVMINKNSASASEIFAGAIKDYKRGVIIGGERTHGKGSVQTVLDFSKMLVWAGFSFNAGSIKYTNAMFFRVNGSSTQVKGVESDIILNSYYDVMNTGEGQIPNALPWSAIKEQNHQVFINNLPNIIKNIKEMSNARVKKNERFIVLNESLKAYKKLLKNKKTSLNLETRWKEYLHDRKVFEKQNKFFEQDAKKRKLKKNKSDKTKKKEKFYDLYIDEGCNIMIDYINQLNK